MTIGFLSHSKVDRELATVVRDRFIGAGYADLFFDEHPDQGLVLGKDWVAQLISSIRRADMIVYLATAAANSSRWCTSELCLARSFGREIIPLLPAGGTLPELLSSIQAHSLDVASESCWRSLWGRLDSAGLPPHAAAPTRGARPYPGLRAFAGADRWAFFGREDDARDLLGRIRVPRRAGHALLVVGPSGVGKSSLVAAGVLPALAATGWLVLSALYPSSNPISRLSALVQRKGGLEQVGWAIDSGPDLSAAIDRIFAESADSVGQGEERWLLHVDQAEELFTRCNAGDRRVFLELMREALAEDERLSVVLSMRSEYLTHWLADPTASQLTARHVPILPLNKTQLQRVILEPARRAKLEIDQDLLAKIVEDVPDGTALPLLAYVLESVQDVAEREGGRALTLAMYEQVGGLQGAVSRAADRAVSNLDIDQADQDFAVRTLLNLVTVDEESGVATRRRWAMTTGVATEARAVIESFQDQRLVTVDGDGSGGPSASVAHETLFQSWEPLRVAIKDAGDFLQLRRRVEVSRRDWERGGREVVRLLDHVTIDHARKVLLGDQQVDLFGAEDRTFLLRSAAVADALPDEWLAGPWKETESVCDTLMTEPTSTQDLLAGCKLAGRLPANDDRIGNLIRLTTSAGDDQIAVIAALAAARLGAVERVLEALEAPELRSRRGLLVVANLRNDARAAPFVLAQSSRIGRRRLGWNALRALLSADSQRYLTLAGQVAVTGYVVGLTAGALSLSSRLGWIDITLLMLAWVVADARHRTDGSVRRSTVWLLLGAGLATTVASEVPRGLASVVTFGFLGSDPRAMLLEVVVSVIAVVFIVPAMVRAIRSRGTPPTAGWGDLHERQRIARRIGAAAGLGSLLSNVVQFGISTEFLGGGVPFSAGYVVILLDPAVAGFMVTIAVRMTMSDMDRASGYLVVKDEPVADLLRRVGLALASPWLVVAIGLVAGLATLTLPVSANFRTCGPPLVTLLSSGAELRSLEVQQEALRPVVVGYNEQGVPVVRAATTFSDKLDGVERSIADVKECRDAAVRSIVMRTAVVLVGLAGVVLLLRRRRRATSTQATPVELEPAGGVRAARPTK